ncbi:MAG: hypothetical protein KY439_08100, partial [Actinobacteria bacterium]|nr:hypothetical protein [Actinomycetota bacterium]
MTALRAADSVENDREHLDSLVTQLLNDLRNTLLGVQILLAVLAAVSSSALLVAPAQYHRLRWNHEPRPETMRLGRRLATAGSASLAVAV